LLYKTRVKNVKPGFSFPPGNTKGHKETQSILWNFVPLCVFCGIIY